MTRNQVVGYIAGLLMGLVGIIYSQWPIPTFRMIVCDVGQGDGILLLKGNTQIVVDGGPSGEKMLSCLEQYTPFWDREIELIVLTNTDYDHMNGLSSVVERYQVRQFVTADGVHSSAALDKFTAIIRRRGVDVKGVGQGDVVRILGQDSIELKVLWPPEVKNEYVAVIGSQMDSGQREQILGASAKRGNLNERSVVLEILEDSKQYLLMGDAGDQAEEVLLKSGLLHKIVYLKVGHHGSKYASSLDFLELVRPEIAVISVGKGNKYGHPTNEALERLARVGAKVERTDHIGTIVH